MTKVSIIVPVYNVEDYLPKCLETLVNQTLGDMEIIVVNDGATDGSQAVIDSFVSRYSNVKSLIKPNGGLSDARNYGMPYATGEYIGFVDSDDYVDLDMYENLYRKAKEADYDIVECNLHHVYPDGSIDTEIGEKITDRKACNQGRLLADIAHQRAHRHGKLLHIEAHHPKGAGGGIMEAADGLQNGGLSRPIGTQQTSDNSRPDHQTHRIHCQHLGAGTIHLCQGINFYHLCNASKLESTQLAASVHIRNVEDHPVPGKDCIRKNIPRLLK